MHALTALVLAAIPALAAQPEKEPEKPFTWPAVRYDGEARSASWLESAYTRFSGRIVLADGRYLHLDEPLPEGRTRRLAKVVAIEDLKTVACETAAGTRVSARLAGDGKADVGCTVVLTNVQGDVPGKLHRGVVVMPTASWFALPAEPQPISRAQFAEALSGGFLLAWTKACPKCSGRGHIFVKTWRRNGMIKEEVSRRKECPDCDGKGQLSVARP